jgi:hypothetical protein
MVTEFLERPRYEGNIQLLDGQEFPAILQNLQSGTAGRARRSRWRRGMFQIRQRYEFAQLIYPGSPLRRFCYQIRSLKELAEKAWGRYPA